MLEMVSIHWSLPRLVHQTKPHFTCDSKLLQAFFFRKQNREKAGAPSIFARADVKDSTLIECIIKSRLKPRTKHQDITVY